MFTKTLSAGLVALLASSVSAQTHTDCSPLKKDCPPDAALGKSISIDYTQGADKSGFFKQLDGTSLEYGDKGAVFKIEGEAQAPTLVSNKYIFFGRIDVQLQAAPGVGIVTSVVLQSDDLDEIDWEWVGGDTKQVQTNYFSKGDTTTYDRGAFHPVANPQSTFHTYSIDWTKDYVRWIIDGNVVRELTYAAAKGGSAFPQTPCQIRIGIWVAGRKDAAKGTVDWAGGYGNFADAPFIGYYKSVKVTDYSTGATSYVYGDRSGTYQSIQIKTDGSSDNTNSTSDASTSPTGSTSSAAPTSSSNSSTSGTGSASNTTATGSGSSSQPSQTSSTASTSAPLSNAGKTGSSAGAAQTTPVAPSSGAASLPNIFMVGAAAVIGYLAL